MTLFEQCVAAAEAVPEIADGFGGVCEDFPAITRAVLETLRDHTASPRTVDELTRVLAEGA